MIHIAVITRQGAPAGQSIAADFGPNGGTIGRADTNTLVLDDPDRTVSRVHAQVLCRDGQYFVIDRGSNPMQCNGVSLGSGKEAPLADGARLIVGSFELSVRMMLTFQLCASQRKKGLPCGAWSAVVPGSYGENEQWAPFSKAHRRHMPPVATCRPWPRAASTPAAATP